MTFAHRTKKAQAFRLNQVSRGTEMLFHLVLALFSLCCILPFVFVIIISFSGGEHQDHWLFLLPRRMVPGGVPAGLQAR